jgi:hypothetical protein
MENILKQKKRKLFTLNILKFNHAYSHQSFNLKENVVYAHKYISTYTLFVIY